MPGPGPAADSLNQVQIVTLRTDVVLASYVVLAGAGHVQSTVICLYTCMRTCGALAVKPERLRNLLLHGPVVAINLIDSV